MSDKDSEDLERLERRLDALRLEQSLRKSDLQARCRDQLSSPGALFTAGLVGVVLGLLGGGGHHGPRATPDAVATGGMGMVGGLVALAGLAGTALRLLELGVVLKSATTPHEL